MQLSKFDFVHYDMMSFTDRTFHVCFEEDIELQKYDYSNTAMGWFVLEYEYKKKRYNIIFENDRLAFSVRIIDREGYHTSLYRMMQGVELESGLTQKNVEQAINLLKEELEKDNICFYISKNNKQYKKENGKISRIKYPFMA